MYFVFLQIATAVYFVLIDVVTMSQYIYYVMRNQGCQGELACESEEKPGEKEREGREREQEAERS